MSYTLEQVRPFFKLSKSGSFGNDTRPYEISGPHGDFEKWYNVYNAGHFCVAQVCEAQFFDSGLDPSFVKKDNS